MSSHSEKWRVLLLDSTPEDRPEIQKSLTAGHGAIEFHAVESRTAYESSLENFHPDVILSEYELSDFNALDALSHLHRLKMDIPFLLVTGAHSEEVAVDCMKQGAEDYILKSSLRRLPSAVAKAMERRKTRKQMESVETTLRKQEKQYRLIAEHTRDLIQLLDAEGQFTFASPSFQKTLGYAPVSLIGRKVFDLLPPEDQATARKAFQDAIDQRSAQTVQYRCLHKDGAALLFESVVSWAFNEKGVPNHAVVVSRHIDDRKRLEDQIRQVQKMEAVGRLAGGVAHDFNNLLTAITGYSELLIRSMDTQDPRRADVEEIKETAARAATLTQQLLIFSRRQITRPTVLDLNQVVSALEKMLHRLIGEDIELRTRLAAPAPHVLADVSQIEQIILNLTLNSRDAMPHGGKLTIQVAARNMEPAEAREHHLTPGRYAVLSVTDTGVGMNEETLGHLFEPFFTTKERHRGSGLGLSTVYGIVQQAGGQVRVESEVGRGTTFWIYLPEVQLSASPTAESEPDAVGRGTETLLLAEDDRSVRTLAVRVLSQNGYRVVEASNGEEALRLFQKNPGDIDLLVTDVVMNGLSGPEMAKEALKIRPELKVLYLSGYMESDSRNELQKVAASSFLPKPFRPRDLLERVRQTLDGPTPRETQPR